MKIAKPIFYAMMLCIPCIVAFPETREPRTQATETTGKVTAKDIVAFVTTERKARADANASAQKALWDQLATPMNAKQRRALFKQIDREVKKLQQADQEDAERTAEELHSLLSRRRPSSEQKGGQ